MLIDLDEHRRLALFEQYFHMRVWFALFPPGEAPWCYVFTNQQIADAPRGDHAGKTVLRFDLGAAARLDHRRDRLIDAVTRYRP